jgi:hypothetical protein
MVFFCVFLTELLFFAIRLIKVSIWQHFTCRDPDIQGNPLLRYTSQSIDIFVE